MRTQRPRSVRPSGVAGLLLASMLAPAPAWARPQAAAPAQPAPYAAQAPAPAQAAPYAAQAPAAPYYAPPPAELFASNLGITYRLEPYGASQGARLTRYPTPGSPAAQIQLEPGDMITALDGQPIYGPNDVLAHTAQTSVQFVNIRTGLTQTNWVFIAGPGPGPFPPPQPPNPFPLPYPDPALGPLPYTMGVATQLTAVAPNQIYAAPAPGQAPQLAYRPTYGLRVTQVVPGGAAQRVGLEPGDIIMTANGMPMSDGNALRRAIASSSGTLNLTIRDVRNPSAEIPVTVWLDPSGNQIYASPAPTP